MAKTEIALIPRGTSPMNRDDVLAILRAEEPRLRSEFGVKSLALFGSFARNQAHEVSDVDLLVEFHRPVGLFGLIRLQKYLEERLGCKVDLGTPASLKPRIRERVMAESIHVA
jgi:predicted nucleotidyltransferase